MITMVFTLLTLAILVACASTNEIVDHSFVDVKLPSQLNGLVYLLRQKYIAHQSKELEVVFCFE